MAVIPQLVSCEISADNTRRSKMIVHVDLAGGVAVIDRFASRPASPTDQAGAQFAAVLKGLLEGHPKFAIEVGVDQRVQSRIEVADPED